MRIVTIEEIRETVRRVVFEFYIQEYFLARRRVVIFHSAGETTPPRKEYDLRMTKLSSECSGFEWSGQFEIFKKISYCCCFK